MSFVVTVPAQVNVLTANYDNFRTNANLSETILNIANVNSSDFGFLFTLPVEGQVYAQPLYVSGLAIPGLGTHDVVFVVTMHNDVYAFDAAGQALLWHVNLGPAVPSSNYNPSFSDIKPDVGILSTPVIDLEGQTMFVVAATFNGETYPYFLHALDLATGQEKLAGPVEINGSVEGSGSADGVVLFDPFQHLQRPGLLLSGGQVYIAFGSHGDMEPYHGWIFAYDSQTLAKTSLFSVTPDGESGSIWQSGHGLAADEYGWIYAITSNGTWDGVRNFSQSFLKLSPDLHLSDWFTPDNYDITNEVDDDLGSTGAIVVPGSDFVIGGGKDGFLCVVDRNAMGRLELGNTQVRQRFPAVPASIFDLALWSRTDGARVFVQGIVEPMKSYRLVGGQFDTTPVTQGTQYLDIPYQGMAISANGSDEASGILWVTSTTGDAGWPGTLAAYDASHLERLLWSSNSDPANHPGRFAKFVAPTVANGRVYVPTFSDQVAVYGQKSQPAFPVEQPNFPDGFILASASSHASRSLIFLPHNPHILHNAKQAPR